MIEIVQNDGLHEVAVRVCNKMANIARDENVNRRHERLGHCSPNLLRVTLPHILGINWKGGHEENYTCSACILGKSTREPRNPNENTQSSISYPVERVYSAVVSPIKTPSLGKSKYFVTLFGEFSGYSMVIIIHRKSETRKAVIAMKRELDRFFNSGLIQFIVSARTL